MLPEKNYYKEAIEALRRRRSEAEAMCDFRRREIYEAVPRVEEIDKTVSTLALSLVAATVGGGKSASVEDVKQKTEALRSERARLLGTAGFPADYTDLKFSCEKCRDTGFCGVNMCSCLKRAIAEARLVDSDMGPLAKTQSFENFSLDYYNDDNRRVVEYNFRVLKKFAESFDGKEGADSWLLIGDTGLGKTHLSTALGVEVIRRGYDVVYKSAQSMIDDFEAEQFHGADRSVVQKYYDCDLLIIDDLGVEMFTQFSVSCLYNIINTRLNARRPSVISTNLTQKELRDRYADRITSRLFGAYKPLVFAGIDVRRQKLSER